MDCNFPSSSIIELSKVLWSSSYILVFIGWVGKNEKRMLPGVHGLTKDTEYIYTKSFYRLMQIEIVKAVYKHNLDTGL